MRPMLAAACAIAAVALLNAQTAGQRERAPVWPIAANDYESNGDSAFPEQMSGRLLAQHDIGLAFSGGGVRSGAETTGELRGLREIKLLDERVAYVSAVSGGAWAVIPWTFSGVPNLLGRYREPGALRYADVTTIPNGALDQALTDVELFADVLKEVGLTVWQLNVNGNSQQFARVVRDLLGQAKTTDRTYQTLLTRNLINRLIPDAPNTDFEQDVAQNTDYAALNPGIDRRRVLYPQPKRPFMIINANVLNAGADVLHSGVTPIELTPLYVGSRGSIGGLFGGMYTSPSAYNAATAARVRDKDGVPQAYIDYTHTAARDRISLADLAASSGAAPLYWLAGGNGLPSGLQDVLRKHGAADFPTFTHLAMRHDEVVRPDAVWPHADGGARDNLGLTALLARHVRKIIVFVNVNNPDFANNDDIQAFFKPGAVSSSGDKRNMVMFADADAKYTTLIGKLDTARREHRPLVGCDVYDVPRNREFNIRAYKGVHICWVYPDRTETWIDALPHKVRALVELRKEPADNCQCGTFQNFPWFSTFFQNNSFKDYAKLQVLKLSTPQTNLLSDLTAWTIVHAKDTLEDGLDK